MKDTGENAVAKWLVIAGRQISQYLGQQLAGLGLTASQYYYILKIHDNPGLTQKELIEAEFINPSNVTRAIKQLVTLGFVVRQQSPTDKRAFQLNLTTEGEALYPKLNAILQKEETEVRQAAKDVIPDFDADQFVAVLHLISHLHGDTDKQ